MLNLLAGLLGFIMVSAHVPWWSQPAIEPKSIALLAFGGLAWCWLSWKNRPIGRYPWTFLLPFGWLLLTSFWSPAPFLGFQRILWVSAACGIGTFCSDENCFDHFMRGFLTGSALHAIFIFMQWIPPIRMLLPPSVGFDAYQGIGRGLFHNTNMAAQPLLFLAAWLLLYSKHTRHWGRGHLVWVIPALTLTQSRLAIAACAGIIAFHAVRERQKSSNATALLLTMGLQLLMAFAYSLTAHRWGWIFPAMGCALAFSSTEGDPLPPWRPLQQWLLYSGLIVAIAAGMGTYAMKNSPKDSTQNIAVQGDMSLSQRRSYYRVGTLAFLDSPLIGQGLGSARPLFPHFVDRNHPAMEIAYGDMLRPNNLHSEPIELLVEGGMLLWVLLLIGFRLDYKGSFHFRRAILVFPLLGLALLDFPLHSPIGPLWLGLSLVCIEDKYIRVNSSFTTRILYGTLGLGLLLLAGVQARVSQMRPYVERQFLSMKYPIQTNQQARSLWKAYPFSADLFDLYSKSTIQAAAASPTHAMSDELDHLLRLDPWDHHLLLARAQMARRNGDTAIAQACLDQYTLVAPKDPARYIRLAKDALIAGRNDQARILAEEAEKQPGFDATQKRQIEQLFSDFMQQP
jgi:hypothetical protein